MATQLTDSNFKTTVLDSGKVAIVDFWAEWCGPCKAIGPLIEEISKEFDDKAIVGKVDVDSNPETAMHRLYNQGESTRHLDWKVLARTGKMFVKRYEEETNLRCQIVIDASSSMYFPNDEGAKTNKLRFSILSAAALVNLLKRQRD